ERGAGDRPQTRDVPRLLGTVLQVDPDHPLVPVVDPLEVTDKAFILHDLHDGLLPLLSGNIHAVVIGRQRVPDAGQEGRKRLGDHHAHSLLSGSGGWSRICGGAPPALPAWRSVARRLNPPGLRARPSALPVPNSPSRFATYQLALRT